MPQSSSQTRRAGRPPATSREQIVAAARHILEQDGAERLTIRRLAADLGVGPPTLYRHVRDREDLLVLLVNDFVEQVHLPEFGEDPRGRIIQAATFIRDQLAEWPWGAEVLTSDGFIGRLGDTGLSLVETIVAGAIEAGCTPEQAVQVFRNLWYFAVGEILVRSHSSRERLDNPDLSFDPTRYPQLARIGARWADVAEEDTFAAGVEAFVDGQLACCTDA